ncbi:MAG: 4-(cytidine 5'-diphospho)-2-C-methyl-D-erythritol kinase [Candidatus Aminicenantes bacterium]|nr:4-(cytidine 5'-diphospho)-2-C-methyl-D-erythritol kinase [Candidatus Aminicenantes bacterium]
MRIKSFAKINLGLEVLRKREDNYHDIRTLFQSIDLYDLLKVEKTSQGDLFLDGSDNTISWGEDNLIFKAASLLKERFGVPWGARISVDKRIPAGKGLGGGSSNAAMTLYALNELWGIRLDNRNLMDLGRELGADIPYFLEGGLCLGVERGDLIIPLNDVRPFLCLLVLPEFSILTSSIYQRVDLSLTSSDKASKIIKFLGSRDFSLLENELEETVFSLYPQIKEIKSILQNVGSELSLVSGTGAAVFGLFFEKERAMKGLKKLKRNYSSLLVEPISRECYWNSIKSGV